MIIKGTNNEGRGQTKNYINKQHKLKQNMLNYKPNEFYMLVTYHPIFKIKKKGKGNYSLPYFLVSYVKKILIFLSMTCHHTLCKKVWNLKKYFGRKKNSIWKIGKANSVSLLGNIGNDDIPRTGKPIPGSLMGLRSRRVAEFMAMELILRVACLEDEEDSTT